MHDTGIITTYLSKNFCILLIVAPLLCITNLLRFYFFFKGFIYFSYFRLIILAEMSCLDFSNYNYIYYDDIGLNITSSIQLRQL